MPPTAGISCCVLTGIWRQVKASSLRLDVGGVMDRCWDTLHHWGSPSQLELVLQQIMMWTCSILIDHVTYLDNAKSGLKTSFNVILILLIVAPGRKWLTLTNDKSLIWRITSLSMSDGWGAILISASPGSLRQLEYTPVNTKCNCFITEDSIHWPAWNSPRIYYFNIINPFKPVSDNIMFANRNTRNKHCW